VKWNSKWLIKLCIFITMSLFLIGPAVWQRDGYFIRFLWSAHKGVSEFDFREPWMARKFLIVAPACYPISYYPQKRALRITTSSHGGAGSSTGRCSGTTDSGTSSSCCRLELAACHVWYCVRCLALFRSPPPLFISSISISEAIHYL
jgi:hypothetical protein